MLKIKNILLDKFKKGQLAHCYQLFNTNLESDHKIIDLELWFNQFSQQLIAPFTKTSFENHSDVLIIGIDKDKNLKNIEITTNRYQVDDLVEINSFLSHKPLELPGKIIVLYHAHLLSEIVQNKLLKALEEPANKTTFFILNPLCVNLLPTIDSRCQKLRIWTEQTDTHKEKELYIIQRIRESKLHEFLESDKQDEYKIIESFMAFCKQCDVKNINRAIDIIKWLDKSKTINNSYQQRLFDIYQFVSENI